MSVIALMVIFDIQFGSAVFILVAIMIAAVGGICALIYAQVKAGQQQVAEKSKCDATQKAISQLQPQTHSGIIHPEALPPAIDVKNIRTFSIDRLEKMGTCVVIDTETTGLSYKNDRIVEIAIVVLENWEVRQRYHSLVNPERQMPIAASSVNNIHDSDLINAPVFADIAQSVKTLIDGKLVVGYNLKFDISFIDMEFRRVGITAKATCADILAMARCAYPSLYNHKLRTVAQHVGAIKYGEVQKHRAMDDVDVTINVLRKVVDTLIPMYEAEALEWERQMELEQRERERKYSSSPLYDKAFFFAGIFPNIDMAYTEILDSVGAVFKGSVSRNVHYVVLGDSLEIKEKWIESIKKADKLIAEGKSIQKIDEATFLEMIENAKKCLETTTSME